MANLSQQTSPHFLLHQPKSCAPASTVASPHLFCPSYVLGRRFYLCVQVCVCLCRSIMCDERTHAHACGDQRPSSSVVPQERTTLFSETGSLTKHTVCSLPTPVSQQAPHVHMSLHTQVLVLQMCTTVSSLFVGASDPNSGPYARAASMSLNEPSPQPGNSLSKTPVSATWLPSHPGGTLSFLARQMATPGH